MKRPSAGPSAVQIVNVEGGNLLGILIRERREQHVLDHAEHGGARADAQRQGQDGQEGEPRVRADPAHAVSQVLPQRLHGIQTSAVVECSTLFQRAGATR